jgi:hypothetical protein
LALRYRELTISDPIPAVDPYGRSVALVEQQPDGKLYVVWNNGDVSVGNEDEFFALRMYFYGSGTKHPFPDWCKPN